MNIFIKTPLNTGSKAVSRYRRLCLRLLMMTGCVSALLLSGCTPSQPHATRVAKPLMVKQYHSKSQYYYGEKN